RRPAGLLRRRRIGAARVCAGREAAVPGVAAAVRYPVAPGGAAGTIGGRDPATTPASEAAPMIRMACPNCKTILQVKDEQAGAVVACPTCKTRLQAPRPAPAPAAAPPAAAPVQRYYARDGQRFGPFGEA